MLKVDKQDMSIIYLFIFQIKVDTSFLKKDSWEGGLLVPGTCSCAPAGSDRQGAAGAAAGGGDSWEPEARDILSGENCVQHGRIQEDESAMSWGTELWVCLRSFGPCVSADCPPITHRLFVVKWPAERRSPPSFVYGSERLAGASCDAS